MNETQLIPETKDLLPLYQPTPPERAAPDSPRGRKKDTVNDGGQAIVGRVDLGGRENPRTTPCTGTASAGTWSETDTSAQKCAGDPMYRQLPLSEITPQGLSSCNERFI
jgi:hypothetical protein